jgi:hypothetical protein
MTQTVPVHARLSQHVNLPRLDRGQDNIKSKLYQDSETISAGVESSIAVYCGATEALLYGHGPTAGSLTVTLLRLHLALKVSVRDLQKRVIVVALSGKARRIVKEELKGISQKICLRRHM